ncbi:MAG: iron ABC transporter permease [Deltaproteobacteria bacterium]|jgi:iron complex transport system permease protein|nr:iron ABC transporter permease [Deltaproteobacteria bacterium]
MPPSPAPSTAPAGPRRLSPRLAGLALTAAALAALAVSLASGHMPFSLGEIWDVLWSSLTGGEPSTPENRVMVLRQVRLPRLAAAFVSGAALGLSGAVFQGILLNPLADPYTLGVSSGAAFGASLVIVAAMLLPQIHWLASPLAPAGGAFLCSALTLTLVVALASDRDRRLSPASLILAGVILSAILSAALSFVKYLAGDQVGSIVFWLLGSFQARTWTDVALVAGFFAPSLAVALSSAVDLNVMTLGVRAAESLGVDASKTRLKLLAAASLSASAAVAAAGIIGFVGLIVPHLMRLLVGPDHRALLPLSALGGATLLLLADTAVRAWLPGDMPVGVLTALLAGPAFLVVFRRRMKELMQA